mmetsp:Transcript_35117/g.56305  ORF Transcript_35117/g.56305 Transcript_35117/m.56305 type:complete len:353 (+) Transcript_35117:664-1722(+)
MAQPFHQPHLNLHMFAHHQQGASVDLQGTKAHPQGLQGSHATFREAQPEHERYQGICQHIPSTSSWIQELHHPLHLAALPCAGRKLHRCSSSCFELVPLGPFGRSCLLRGIGLSPCFLGTKRLQAPRQDLVLRVSIHFLLHRRHEIALLHASQQGLGVHPRLYSQVSNEARTEVTSVGKFVPLGCSPWRKLFTPHVPKMMVEGIEVFRHLTFISCLVFALAGPFHGEDGRAVQTRKEILISKAKLPQDGKTCCPESGFGKATSRFSALFFHLLPGLLGLLRQPFGPRLPRGPAQLWRIWWQLRHQRFQLVPQPWAFHPLPHQPIAQALRAAALLRQTRQAWTSRTHRGSWWI